MIRNHLFVSNAFSSPRRFGGARIRFVADAAADCFEKDY